MCGGATNSILRALLGDPKELEISLQGLESDEPQAGESSEAGDANAVIYRGTIITMASGQFNPAEAMAVQGDTVLAVGTYDQVQAAVSHLPYTKRDLGSKCIVPGFVEPHLHLLPTALVSGLTDMYYEKAKSVSQARDIIVAAVGETTPGDWVVAFGYDPSLTDDHLALTRDITDAAAPNNPFLCGNPSGHISYVNKAAFAAAGFAVRPNDPDPALKYPGDDPYFIKATDEEGEYLNGVVLETAANTLASKLPSKYLDPKRIVRLGRQALVSWAQVGCTTVFDAGLGVLNGSMDLQLVIRMLKSQTPLPRFQGAIAAQALNKIVPGPLLEPPYVDGPLSLYTVKYWLDGSTQGFTAALNEPYADTNPFPFTSGFLDYRLDPDNLSSGPDDATLLAQLKQTVAAGWQVMLHVNGSRAIDQALRVLPEALSQGPQPPSHMHRLEHFTADVTAEQIAATAKLGLGVSHLIAHVGTWGDAFGDYVLDKARAARIDPVADEVAAGLTVSFHSDSFTSPVQPLRYVDTAVTRLTPSGNVLGPDLVVSLEQAFAGVTYSPAKQLGQLDRIGSLEAGKKADFVVLSSDPRTVEPGHLHDQCKVVETWIGGVLFEWLGA
ncbi:amidohydrolase family-domain-containing protein [Lasiosphaeria hispida]|uniref:Amidohydrolase family-domain-containing protein n=1 Tax=Lasiosphaeria hispida TaxID=260671 RepID=A0AAJ0HF39_9PEZI|nr:amidohydrolase family-domain-containing protein [Lasiosphaeria hispida]